MGANIWTYTDSLLAQIPRQLPNNVDAGTWIGFVKDDETGKWIAKYGDGRDKSETNFTWPDMSDLYNKCTSIRGKIIFCKINCHSLEERCDSKSATLKNSTLQKCYPPKVLPY